MKRRQFIGLVGGTAARWSLAVLAQRPAKIARIGFLGLGPAVAQSSRVKALRAGLRDLGLKTAKALGLKISKSFLLRADAVIE